MGWAGVGRGGQNWLLAPLLPLLPLLPGIVQITSTAMTPRTRSLGRHLIPRQKLWLNLDGAFLMGPRYLRFLEAGEEEGTLRHAARAVAGG